MLTELRRHQAQAHPYCVVCSSANPYGLALQFERLADGVLAAQFQPNPTLEGYEGCMHGGIIASLLDGMMTNLLFAEGVEAVTADLRVRYRAPVRIGPPVVLRAWVGLRHPPLYLVEAELHQEDCLRARASAKFMQRS